MHAHGVSLSCPTQRSFPTSTHPNAQLEEPPEGQSVGGRRLLAFQGRGCDRALTPRTASHRRHSRVPRSLVGALSLAAAERPSRRRPAWDCRPTPSPRSSPRCGRTSRCLATPATAGAPRSSSRAGRGDAGDHGSWTFAYTAGPLGIADGGWLFFQVRAVLELEHPAGPEPRAPASPRSRRGRRASSSSPRLSIGSSWSPGPGRPSPPAR